MSEFHALSVASQLRQQQWPGAAKITPAYQGNELAGEAGEACNVIKKLERERLGIAGSRDTVEHLAEELGDVIICVDMIATTYGIDLWEAVKAKFNATSRKGGMDVFL